jgi:hypothetical protein
MVQWELILAVFKYNMCATVQLNGTDITSFFESDFYSVADLS